MHILIKEYVLMSEEKAQIKITETEQGLRIDIAGKSLKDLGGCCVKVASECCSGEKASECCSEESREK